MKLIKKDNLKVAKWSGGTTTEIAIYPQDTVYSDRDFIWRISSAVVSDEESTFTNLQGYDRILMVLEGELTINHEGHHSCILRKFEQDRFDGGWITHSQGKVTDFNLMMRQNSNGNIEVLDLEDKLLVRKIYHGFENMHLVLYCLEGSFNVGDYTVQDGDALFVLDFNEDIEIDNYDNIKAKIIATQIAF